MGTHYDFSVYPEDNDNVKKVTALYPRMKFSRLMCMIIKQWIEQKEHGDTSISPELNKALKEVEKLRQRSMGLNDFL